MTRKLYCLTMLMFLLTAVHAQGLQGYEYWIDNDYAGRRAVSTTDADISFQLSADDIGQGVHFMNFHAQGTDGEWGSAEPAHLLRARGHQQPRHRDTV